LTLYNYNDIMKPKGRGWFEKFSCFP